MTLTSQNRKILLVDDERDIRDVLLLILNDMGGMVKLAGDGKEALHLFSTFNPHIVITDIKMPNMDGIELLKHIKRENVEVEVIMITGHGDMDLAIKSLKNQATDFITKPVNADAFEFSVRRAWEKIVIREKLKEYTENLETLVQEKIEMQDHLSALGLMVGSISHAIKGLLTGLDGGIYVLNSGISKKDRGQVDEGAEIITTMVARVRKLVQDILFYTKERRLTCEKVNAVLFAKGVAETVKPQFAQKSIVFIENYLPEPVYVNIDQGYMQSALINILENAADACMAQEEASIRHISFSVSLKKNRVVFKVKDKGIGMDERVRKNIFSLFYSSKERTGTGIGLFVSKKIIDQHNGEIIVKSDIGKGSTFKVLLPVDRSSHI